MPTVVRKDIDSNSSIISVTLTREDIQKKVDAELKRFRNRAGIKGFRQGHAPMPYVRKMFGASILFEVFNDAMAHELYAYLKESDLDVLGQPLPAENQQLPALKLDQLEAEYTVDYEIGYVNKFEIQGLDAKQSFERLTVSDIDDLAEKDLDYARNRMGKRTNPEEDIQENDILRIQAKEVDGEWETTITALVKNITDPALKAELLTKKKGDTVRFNARHLEEEQAEHLYRKYVLNIPDEDDRKVGDLFEGTIEEVSRVDKAEMNDEFFQGYFGGSVSNADQAREEIKKGILGFYDLRSDALLMRAFQERLMELNPIPLPDTFLKRWLRVSNENKLSQESIEREYPAFVENLRWSMLRDKIEEMFELSVSDQEVYDDYARRVRNYFQVGLPDHIISGSVKRLMKDEKDVEKTRRDLETDKIFKAIRSAVTVADKAIPSEEFHSILDELTKKAEAAQAEDAEIQAAIIE